MRVLEFKRGRQVLPPCEVRFVLSLDVRH
jgi:hypothetical protein